MDVCGEAESRLATELMQHEVQIERDILDPLNQLAEVKARRLSSYCSAHLWPACCKFKYLWLIKKKKKKSLLTETSSESGSHDFQIQHGNFLCDITIMGLGVILSVDYKVHAYSWASLFLSQFEIPNILKQRKQLAKLVLDYDSAKTRYAGLTLFHPIIVSTIMHTCPYFVHV